MTTSSRKTFLKEIERFRSRHIMSATMFGRKFAKSPTFVFDLRKSPKGPTLDSVDKIRKAMRKFEREKQL
tara:strand:- start:2168 stop:2377 length:210 start_codon:yes stop_codon:yes gene_type:complete